MITQEQLASLLNYDESTGNFYWLSFRNGRAVRGATAGASKGKYVAIKIFGESYQAHRLAWLYVHGAFPSKHIDHIDGNGKNNAIANLREATDTENGQNRSGAQTNNASGFLGVYRVKSTNRYRAQITVDRKQMFLGSFDTPEKAHETYLKAKRELHPFGTL